MSLTEEILRDVLAGLGVLDQCAYSFGTVRLAPSETSEVLFMTRDGLPSTILSFGNVGTANGEEEHDSKVRQYIRDKVSQWVGVQVTHAGSRA